MRIGSPRRVVVVEDNPDIRSTLDLMLRLWGHDVDSADDGISGLECILRSEPDVALIDIGLPGMNGYDVARAVRRRCPHSAIKLVAITGYGQPPDLFASTEAGFDEHLLKPVEPEVLKQLMSRLR